MHLTLPFHFSPMEKSVHTENYEIKSILSVHMVGKTNVSYDMDKIGSLCAVLCMCLLFFVSCVFRFCLNVLVFLCSCWLLLLLISSSSFSVFHFHRHSFMNYVPVYTPYTEKELTLVHLSAWESTREQNDFNLVNVNVPILACYYWRRFVGPLFSHSVSL